jgi:ribose transport system ATP-binding protein
LTEEVKSGTLNVLSKPMSDLLVAMAGIDKAFPGVRALEQCRFELRAGEVHALVGENGAGKSTLMKVLAGVYASDAGRILFQGAEVQITSPRAAQSLGISIIHQELNLMPHLTVAQNIFIGREPRRALRCFLDERAINDNAQALLARLKLALDARARVSDLTVAKQQMVEIAKALSYDSKVLIMDEPTAALTGAEIDDLFRIIRELRDKGVGVVHISHRLEELPMVADRITVLRDGRHVETLNTPDCTREQLIRLMVGRAIYEGAPEGPALSPGDVILEVRDLRRGRALRGVSFSARRGEIIGFAGLVGAGRTEVARAIFGADPVDSGEIRVRGKKVRIRSPHDAVQHGIAYLSEDRKRFGLNLGMDVETNIVLATFRRFLRRLGWVDSEKTRATAQHYVEMLGIRTPSVRERVKNLSGGNQQKVVIAKWLAAQAEILIFDEPTRGIDVAAKSEIYRLLSELSRQGKAIIMISSELPEILRMSQRIIVMCEGRITGELPSGATQEQIMRYATERSEPARTSGSGAVPTSAPA